MWWLRELRSSGWAVAVAYTFAEARKVLTRYINACGLGQSLDLSNAKEPGHV